MTLRKILRLLLTFIASVAVSVSPVSDSARAEWHPTELANPIEMGAELTLVGSDVHVCPPSGGSCYSCLSESDVRCAGEIAFTAVLPLCESRAEVNCVGGLNVSANGKADDPARYLGSYYNSRYEGWEQLGVRNPAGPLLFAASDGEKLQTLAVSAILSGSYSPKSGVKYSAFSVETEPVSEIPLPQGSLAQCDFVEPWSQINSCLQVHDFAPNVRLNLNLHLTRQVGGWFWGRMIEPQVVINEIESSSVNLDVSGFPASVAIDQVELSKIPKTDSWDQFLREHSVNPYPTDTGGWNLGSAENAMTAISKLAPFAGDMASGIRTFWQFQTDVSARRLADACKANVPVQGLIMSNATAYSHGPPTMQGGTLSYKVAAMHFMPGGVDLYRGFYSMILTKAAAKCIYGISGTYPMSASISVTSSTGAPEVATTSFVESGDTYTFKASSFTFSSPVISARLSEKAPQPKKSIICVRTSNKKVKKSVVGVNPKCPKGYVKSQ